LPICRDPSFTPEAVFEKEKKYFPRIKLAQPELPDGVRWEKDLVYHVFTNPLDDVRTLPVHEK
jgi:hypothetical protein